MPGFSTDGMPTVPVGYTFTGAELVAVDTGLGQGINPATFACSLAQLGFGSMQTVVPLTGFSITVTAPTNILQLTPAGTLATGTIVFPSNAVNGQTLRIMSTQIVTALTLTPGQNPVGGVMTNQTINSSASALAANTALEWQYQASNNTWYRIQ
jgi:hypothetical protein